MAPKLEASYPPPPNLYYDITQEAQYMFGELLSSRETYNPRKSFG